MKKNIFIIAEHDGNKISPVTYEMISCAESISSHAAAEISVILIGYELSLLAESISKKSGKNVLSVNSANLKNYNNEGYRSAIIGIIHDFRPDLIIIPHTPTGYDFAPGLAISLNAACITSVDSIGLADETLIYTRSGFFGKQNMVMTSLSPITVITVSPGAYSYNDKRTVSKGNISIIESPISLKKTKSVRIIESSEDNTKLGDAEVIVSAGRGIEKKENLQLISDFSKIFPKSAVGGSRVVCDLGWLDYKSQIGLTGKAVSPKLYIACGISGATQHVSGIKGAKFIVSINRDPNAAIFNFSDVCIIEDLKKFIPIFINESLKYKC